jgi:hypothetical protein
MAISCPPPSDQSSWQARRCGRDRPSEDRRRRARDRKRAPRGGRPRRRLGQRPILSRRKRSSYGGIGSARKNAPIDPAPGIREKNDSRLTPGERGLAAVVRLQRPGLLSISRRSSKAEGSARGVQLSLPEANHFVLRPQRGDQRGQRPFPCKSATSRGRSGVAWAPLRPPPGGGDLRRGLVGPFRVPSGRRAEA